MVIRMPKVEVEPVAVVPEAADAPEEPEFRVEIQAFAMCGDTLAPHGQEPEYWDIEVRKEPDSGGGIEILEEFNDIKDVQKANEIIQSLEEKYGVEADIIEGVCAVPSPSGMSAGM